MNRARLSIFASIALLASQSLAAPKAAEQSPRSIPLRDFFSASDISNLRISPGGNCAAFMTTLATGHIGIALFHLDTGKAEPLVGPRDENVSFFFWKGDDRIVYGGDVGGNESPALRAISISKRRVIALAESYRERYAEQANWARMVSQLPDDPDNIIVYGNSDVGSFAFGYWKLDVRTGKRWFAGDIQGERNRETVITSGAGVILARARDEGSRVIYEVRSDDRATFKQVAQFGGTEQGWEFLRLAGDDETLYLLTNDKTDTHELRTLNLRTHELSAPLFHAPGAEITSLLTSEDRKTLYGVIYEDDRFHYHFFDKARAQIQAQIDASLPNTFNLVVDASRDEQLLAIFAFSDTDPGTYYILDRRVPRIMQLGKARSRINPALMRPMEAIQFVARDGLVIHGYLTRPAGHDDTPGPLVVLPHGGPFEIRDSWGFDPEVQFLASRGYAVLQVNYRGSGGYGAAFVRAGWKEWGGRMQDDLTDAVKWAVEHKAADPERIAIFGASYGGYAALAGVTFTPDLYRCAINYVGVSDLKILKRWGNVGTDSTVSYLENCVGTDAGYVESHSPVNFVDRIRVPTMHIYGFNDPRVDIDHWKRLRAKLVAYKKPFEEMVAEDEGHGFDNEENRIEAYTRIATFLEKYLPADNQ